LCCGPAAFSAGFVSFDGGVTDRDHEQRTKNADRRRAL
jgi:hypothetical protein